MTHPERFDFISDPDDRKFAALAHAALAALVSNDEHLLGVRDRIGATVLSSGACWRMRSEHLDSPEAAGLR